MQTHVMGLDSDFHTSKGAKKIFFAVYRGKNILELVDIVSFQVMSMFIDLTLIFGYLIYVFGPYIALNLVATASAYLYIMSKLTLLANSTLEERSMCYIKEWEALQSTISNWKIAAVSSFRNIFYISLITLV
jgi:ABC-type transport system involved in Fe-S cluster assembly fused permease/ATPase subunit